MKSDLLGECNDQRVPPNEFTDTFCKRCRNAACTRAGWATSTFEQRVQTQVDRLLVNPLQARPEDSRFDPVRALRFVEVAAAIALAKREDPWAGPGVHLADPPPEVSTSRMVEEAVSKLAVVQGKEPPVTVEPPVEVAVPVPQPPLVDPQSGPLMNTDFPEEGVMIGGSTPPVPVKKTEADPWAPKAKVTVVPRGTKIRMGP